MKKYEFTDETKEWNGRTLHRIRALFDVRDGVRAGDLGGWIESEENLEQSDTSWVYSNAIVTGNAVVDGNARINSREDLLVVGPIGFRGDYTTFAKAESGIFVKCGCFGGMLEKFEEAAKRTHRESAYAKEYMLAIKLAKQHILGDKNEDC